MKHALAILMLIVCACSISTSENERDELQIRVEVTTGEMAAETNGVSRTDGGSISQTTTIIVERDVIVLMQGAPNYGMARPAVKRTEFKLSPADKRNLRELIRSNNLLVTDTLSLPQHAPVSFFSVSVALAVGDKKGDISISGPQGDVQKIREEKLYHNTLALVIELRRIMRRQDKSVTVCATFFC